MNFRWTTWGVGLLGVLALPGCSGDDTPTPDFLDGSTATGAGGAVNDSSVVVAETSTGKSGGSVSDAPVMCSAAAPMSVTGQNIGVCKASLADAASDDAGGSGCFACLCNTCPKEAAGCIGNPFCKAINDCCRSLCKCSNGTPEAGSDAPASDAPSSEAASSSDSAASDGAAE